MSQLPVSYTTAGAATGMVLGSIVPGLGTGVGYMAGAIVGGAIDLGIKIGLFGTSALKKQEKQMKAAFYAALQKRYNTQVFADCVGIIGSAMLYIEALGFKPTNPDGTLNQQFDTMLKQKLSTGTCIYNGNCNITLYSLDQNGNLQATATLNNDGTVQAYSPNFDLNAGPLWKQACHDLTLAAYQAWADDYRDNLLFQQEMAAEQDQETQSITTKVLVNLGLMLLMFGYIMMEKGKIEELREYKAKRYMGRPIPPRPVMPPRQMPAPRPMMPPRPMPPRPMPPPTTRRNMVK